MIKIKSKYNYKTDELTVKYNAKHTSTYENLCLIERICDVILENQDDMTINKIFDEVKKMRKENEENGK